MEKKRSEKFLKQRMFLTVLPLLVLPFVTLAFWALGGGESTGQENTEEPGTGLIMELPPPIIKEDPAMDKMKYYEKAERELEKHKRALKQDPYYSAILEKERPEDAFSPVELLETPHAEVLPVMEKDPLRSDPKKSEEEIYKKLEVLNKTLSQSESVEPVSVKETSALPQMPSVGVTNADIDRLEEMMGIMQGSNVAEDPELQQLGELMDKILDIQHPERVQQRLEQVSAERKGQVFAVSSKRDIDPVTSLEPQDSIELSKFQEFIYQERNGFYSLEDSEIEAPTPNAIEAVVHETQTLVNGETVKLRLLDDAYINGIHIPKDHFVFGKANINGDRLQIDIESIRHGASLFPVALSVYDMDGMSGIHIPGAISRDVMKQSANQTIQGLGLMSVDPSLGAQAASAGIEISKKLLSKKVKLVQIQVKAGYRVLLLDEKQQMNL
jgi:conjugative transposon TraM protein